MNPWVVCIERGFSLTNEMLKHLRAAGKYQGIGAARKVLPSLGFDKYAEEVADIRRVVALHFRRFAHERSGQRVDVRCLFVGHEKHDPDAGYLATKAIVDGLTDCSFLESDRREVRWTSGLVAHSDQDVQGAPALARAPGWRGVVVWVEEVGHA